ncbi:MAG: hypothetical protein NVS9B9_27870 [Ktedonobacteraceae bacterium]
MREMETERLRLRVLRRSDLSRISLLLGNASVMRYLGRPLKTKQCQSFLEQFIAKGEDNDFGWWGLIRKDEERLIGLCGLGWVRLSNTNEVELAYLLTKPDWGNGFATEAASRVVQYGFGELGLERIIAITRYTNDAARRVAEKVGMRLAGTERIANRQYLFYLKTRQQFPIK